MAVISIFSGAFCQGEEVVKGAAEKLGYELVEDVLIEATTARFGGSANKYIRVMEGPLPIFNKFTQEREKNAARLKLVLAELIQRDNCIAAGHAGLLLPSTVPHILRVLIIANHDYRVKLAMESSGKSEKEAEKAVHKDDKDRLQWSEFLFEKSPYDDSLYDIVIPMQDTSPEEAVEMICKHAQSEPLATTARSKSLAEDFVLSSKVNLALVEEGHKIEVLCEDGFVTLSINKYTIRLEQYKKEISEIAFKIEGVKGVYTKIGPKFSPPSIIPIGDLEMPSKILLVDDEKEFVHTLSERLEARNLESSIVYDGEQALDFVNKDEPDVMVLDLKMPGIDGIEVLRRVKREHPDVEVIILTGHGSEREENLAAELGAFAYLHKPVDIDILAKAMKEAYAKVNEKRAKGKKTAPSAGESED